MAKALQTTAFLAAGLAAGFAIATLTQRGGDDGGGGVERGDLALADRVAALEETLRQESARRAALAADVDELRGRLPAGRGEAAAADPPMPQRDGAGGSAGDPDPAADEQPDEEARPGARRQRVLERFRGAGEGLDVEQLRVDRLIEAGFAPDRAAWIGRRTAELRMQALQDQYRAARDGEPLDPRTARSAEQALRAELGDADYEKYLEAVGRPTSIGVRSVLASSPAEQAGLLPGDEVVGYAGQRVFDVADLNRLTLEGQPGETVALDVVRDGQQIQLYVPRGPIGLMGGGRFARP